MASESGSAQIRGATAATAEADRTEPRAAAARYIRSTRRVRLDLAVGCAFEFPVDLVQGLRGASAAHLAQVEVTPAGDGLRWDALDVDLSVPGLLAGIFGGKAWTAALAGQMGQKGGAARSPANAAASRANGARGGRPRKTPAP